MIISASRRTDIPAFYAQWMSNRIRAGFCTVPNPFNRRQISRVSLRPEDVDVIVFWTRNPRPHGASWGTGQPQLALLLPVHHSWLPTRADPKSPPISAAVQAFQSLSDRLGPNRVIWRYDPLIFTPLTPADFHRQNFGRLAEMLRGYTRRSVISVVDRYPKVEHRLKLLENTRAAVETWELQRMESLLRELVSLATGNGMEMVSCAEEIDLTPFGIRPGKCIDDQVIAGAFGIQVNSKKDPAQRPACGCLVSRDIGMYNSCLFGCQYCYATQSFERARVNFHQHDTTSPSLVGRYEVVPEPASQKTLFDT